MMMRRIVVQPRGQRRGAGGRHARRAVAQQLAHVAHHLGLGKIAQHGRLQHQPGGERADNRGQPNRLRQPGERQTEANHQRELHAGPGIDRSHQARQLRPEPAPGHDGAAQEQHGFEHGPEHAAGADGAILDQRRQYGKNDQPNHIVNHRCAQHHPRFDRRQLVHVAKHPAGDAHRGGRQCRTEEQPGVEAHAGQQPGTNHPGAEAERHGHTQGSDRKRARADGSHLFQV